MNFLRVISLLHSHVKDREHGWKHAEVKDASSFISRLQSGYLASSATINLFYFTGPDDKAEGASEALSALARKNNGGRFQLLTAKRLEEMAKPEK